MDVREAIRHSHLANGFTQEQIDLVVAIAQVKTYADGEYLMEASDTDQDLFLVLEGKALMLSVTGDVIGHVTPGMPIGEVSFIDQLPRSVTVESKGGCTVAMFPAGAMRQLFAADPSMKLHALTNIIKVLCHRLRSANRNIAALMVNEEAENAQR